MVIGLGQAVVHLYQVVLTFLKICDFTLLFIVIMRPVQYSVIIEPRLVLLGLLDIFITSTVIKLKTVALSFLLFRDLRIASIFYSLNLIIVKVF